MRKGIFVTGTDTGVGKTLVAQALLRGLNAADFKTAGMKPVASGGELTIEGLRNADALALQTAANVFSNYETVNPYAFAPAIAPHLAAQFAGVNIELGRIVASYERLAATADQVIIEGAGGWRLPLGAGQFLSDFAEQLQFAVVLVVGLRLGCLNHAVLTAEAIAARGRCRLLGWVGNQIDPDYAFMEENVASLHELLPCPCMGVIRWSTNPAASAAVNLNVRTLVDFSRDIP